MFCARKLKSDFNAGNTELVSFDCLDNCAAINLKVGFYNLDEKSSFEMLVLSFFLKLNYGSYIFLLLKLPSGILFIIKNQDSELYLLFKN